MESVVEVGVDLCFVVVQGHIHHKLDQTFGIEDIAVSSRRI
jgi:hypothetical protein